MPVVLEAEQALFDWLSLLACSFYFLGWHWHVSHMFHSSSLCSGYWRVSCVACTHTPLSTGFSQIFDGERKMYSEELSTEGHCSPQPWQATPCVFWFLLPFVCLLFLSSFVPSLILSRTCCGFLTLCLILWKWSLFSVLKWPSVAVIVSLLWDMPNYG